MSAIATTARLALIIVTSMAVLSLGLLGVIVAISPPDEIPAVLHFEDISESQSPLPAARESRSILMEKPHGKPPGKWM